MGVKPKTGGLCFFWGGIVDMDAMDAIEDIVAIEEIEEIVIWAWWDVGLVGWRR